MKLDKIRFARLISYLSRNAGGDLCVDEIKSIDDIVDFEMPNVSTDKVDPSRVDELLKQIALAEKIPAIKAYRALTGAGLKESKDAIEAYWLRQPAPKQTFNCEDLLYKLLLEGKADADAQLDAAKWIKTLHS